MRALRKCASEMLRAMCVGAWMLAAMGASARLVSAQGATHGRVVLQGAAYTPAPGSAERRAIMNAVRSRVRTKAVFEVSHLLAADGWAFIRCGEVVMVDGERQETDLYVVALLGRDAATKTWRVVEHWTLTDDREGLFRAFAERVERRVKARAIPRAILPTDFPQNP